MAIWRHDMTTLVDGWGPLPPHATVEPRPWKLRLIERLLLGIAIVCLSYYAYAATEAAIYQAYENRELDAILKSAPPAVPAASLPAVARRPVPAPGSAIGRIEVPRLRVAAVVRAGSDARTLRLAVGHIPGTALPGDTGNVGLAGHRDTFFRGLRDVRPRDEVRVTTLWGTYRYIVERVEVVDPTDVWVLDPTSRPSLTLVTCYPFNYIGAAPRRFIVRATLADSPPAQRPGPSL